ncbi:MAG TPA: hypothetical protein ENG40_00265 [Thermoprotei archaeon]|nr:hypothetical protein [Thermoprotei archaeon]
MTVKKVLDKIFNNVDSSSSIVKATASTLRDKYFDPFGINPKLKPLTHLVLKLGKKANFYLANFIVKSFGINKSYLKFASVENAAKWVVLNYKGNIKRDKYNFIVIGAPSGAAAHLASLLNAPFLTQHFLLLVKEKDRHPDDVFVRLYSGVNTARILNKINGNKIEIIIHYDPVHDRLLIRYLDTIRFKLRVLPREYRTFILNRLGNEGIIVFLDVKYMWKQYRISDNVTFQIGGLGGIGPEEYIIGSDRLKEWLSNQKSSVESWNLGNEYELIEYPESEWSSITGLEEDTRAFADDNGYDFIKITANHPEEVSEKVFNTYLQLLADHNVETDRFFFDCFTAINPLFNLKTSSVPIWLPFNCEDSYRFAKRIIASISRLKSSTSLRIFFTLLPSYIKSPDQLALSDWIKLFNSITTYVDLIGISKKYYPYDILYPFNYIENIRELSHKLKKPLPKVDNEYLKELIYNIIR